MKAIAESLNIGLKEWASVCRALGMGRQIMLLRKGGISESGGEFQVAHREFLLFPTYLHQMRRMLKPQEHADCIEALTEPPTLQLSEAAMVTDVVPILSRQAMDSLFAEHIWATPLIDMRFNYRPENPLYLLLLRVYRLAAPQPIEQMPAYDGCKSWVPLQIQVSTRGAVSVLNDEDYAALRRNILDHLR